MCTTITRSASPRLIRTRLEAGDANDTPRSACSAWSMIVRRRVTVPRNSSTTCSRTTGPIRGRVWRQFVTHSPADIPHAPLLHPISECEYVVKLARDLPALRELAGEADALARDYAAGASAIVLLNPVASRTGLTGTSEAPPSATVLMATAPLPATIPAGSTRAITATAGGGTGYYDRAELYLGNTLVATDTSALDRTRQRITEAERALREAVTACMG